eukprot:SAG25_NODE_33_length_20262_cov_33.203293_5_plen_95_part_00
MGCALPHTYFNEAPCPPLTSHGAPIMLVVWTAWLCVRVRVEIMMGSPTYRIVGKSQSVLAVIHPIVFTRTRNTHDRLEPSIPATSCLLRCEGPA